MLLVCFHVKSSDEELPFASVEFDIDERDGLTSASIKALKRDAVNRFQGGDALIAILHGVFRV